MTTANNLQEKKWYIALQDHHEGPFSAEEIYQRIDSAQIPASVFVWAEGLPDWKKISESEIARQPKIPPLPKVPPLPVMTQVQEPAPAPAPVPVVQIEPQAQAAPMVQLALAPDPGISPMGLTEIAEPAKTSMDWDLTSSKTDPTLPGMQAAQFTTSWNATADIAPAPEPSPALAPTPTPPTFSASPGQHILESRSPGRPESPSRLSRPEDENELSGFIELNSTHGDDRTEFLDRSSLRQAKKEAKKITKVGKRTAGAPSSKKRLILFLGLFLLALVLGIYFGFGVSSNGTP